jgi:hypothetical protein
MNPITDRPNGKRPAGPGLSRLFNKNKSRISPIHIKGTSSCHGGLNWCQEENVVIVFSAPNYYY